MTTAFLVPPSFGPSVGGGFNLPAFNGGSPKRFSAITLSDDAATASVTITGVGGSVGLLNPASGTATIAPGGSSITVSGSIAAIDQDLAGLEYIGTDLSHINPTGIMLSATDASGSAASLSLFIPNEGFGTAPIPKAAQIEFTTLTGMPITLTGLSLVDPTANAFNSVETVVINKSNGSAGSVTIPTLSGSSSARGLGTSTVTISGSLSDVNADLANLQFTGLAGNNLTQLSFVGQNSNSVLTSFETLVTINTTDANLPVISLPKPAVVSGATVAGLSIAASNVGIFTVALTTSSGTLAIPTQAAGTSVALSADHTAATVSGNDTLGIDSDLASLVLNFSGPSTTVEVQATVTSRLSQSSLASFTTGAAAPSIVTVGTDGSVPSFDPTANVILDLTKASSGANLANLAGDDQITVGASGATLAGGTGNDLIVIPATATGHTLISATAGNSAIWVGAGTNTLFDAAGTATYSLTGGTNTVFTGTGHSAFTVSGGSNTVVANQGTANITDSSGSLLLGLLGGSHQANLTAGAPVVLATGGSSTIAASAAAPLVGLFGGDQMVTLGSGSGGVVFGINGTNTVQGGSGLAEVGLYGGQLQVTPGTGTTDLFVFNGSGTLLEQSHAGNVVISGFTPTQLVLAIPHTVNGNNFTSASQVPIAHDASGNTVIDLGSPGSTGSQVILLVGTSSISSGAITLT